jgi:uncharacterized protein HemX
MSCDQFEKYETGEIESREFREHLKTCSYCQEQEKLDARLMNLSRSLREPVQSPGLWERIEHTLTAEEHQRRKPIVLGISRRSFALYAAAALILIAVALGIYSWLFQEKHKPGLLTEAALKKVELREQKYMKAIEELERQTLPRVANMNIELMLLYRDRLETIDAQITRCREALSENPANTHIRRYMLAALQDKKETLLELAGSRLPGDAVNQ